MPFEPKWKIFLNGFVSCIYGSPNPEENDEWLKNREKKQTNKNSKQNSFPEVVTPSQTHCVKGQDDFCCFLPYNSGLKLSSKYSTWRQRFPSNQGVGGRERKRRAEEHQGDGRKGGYFQEALEWLCNFRSQRFVSFCQQNSRRGSNHYFLQWLWKLQAWRWNNLSKVLWLCIGRVGPGRDRQELPCIKPGNCLDWAF